MFFAAFCLVTVLHNDKMCLAIAGIGAAVVAIGLVLFAKTNYEEKHCCHK